MTIDMDELEVAISKALDRALNGTLDNKEWVFMDSLCFSGDAEVQFAGHDNGLVLNFVHRDDDDRRKTIYIATREVHI